MPIRKADGKKANTAPSGACSCTVQKRSQNVRVVAANPQAAQRRIQRIFAEFESAGTAHRLRHPGRKPKRTPQDEASRALQEHGRRPAGVAHVARMPKQRRCDTSYGSARRIMSEGGPAEHPEARSRRRKRVRFERVCPNAAWRVAGTG